jgi:hypothetical protein
MSFTEAQLRALNRAVPTRNVKTRISDGKELFYIEGWYCLVQANRIFGFDAWDRETLETKCLVGHEARGSWTAVYSARVRITVRTNPGTIIRDGHGTGEAQRRSTAEAHDLALKAAETDATKRALATFGKAFGLALYAGTKNGAPIPTGAKADDPGSAPPAPDQIQRSPTLTAEAELEVSQTGARIEPDRQALRSRDLGSKGTFLPRPGIDKSALALSEPKRQRNKNHLRYVAAQPCLLCNTTPCDAHHLRHAQPRAMGLKVSDEFTVPLCRTHHREIHREGNEAGWWHDMGIDPLPIARDLWAESQKDSRTDDGGTT